MKLISYIHASHKPTQGAAGFTVLELLIVIAIMCVLIGLILVGLTSARSHARDEDRVTNVQNVALGLSQFYDACRFYPVNLDSNDPSATCAALGGKTIKDFVPNIEIYKFNQPGSEYHYVSLIIDNTNPLIVQSECTNFHIGVDLEGTAGAFSGSKSGFGPSMYAPGMNVCSAAQGGSPSASDFDGTLDTVFDIKK